MRVAIAIVFLWIAVDAYQVPAKLRASAVPSRYVTDHAFVHNTATSASHTHFYAGLTLVAPLQVGTPPQQLNIWFNFFSPFSWILGPDACATALKPTLFGYERQLYYPNKSSTFLNGTGEFQGFYAYGWNVSDVVQIPGTNTTANVPFGLAEGYWSLGYEYMLVTPADGGIGLGDEREGGFLDSISGKLRQKVMTVWIEGKTDGAYEQDAAITFGHLDDYYCEPNWSFVPRFGVNSWMVSVTSVSIDLQGGAIRSERPAIADIDVSIGGIGGPMKMLKPIVDLAGAKVDEDGRFLVDCDKAHSLPNFTVTFGEVPITITSLDYVSKDEFGTEPCVLEIKYDKPEPDYDIWFFGAVLFNSHCVAYDWGEQKIGFTLSK